MVITETEIKQLQQEINKFNETVKEIEGKVEINIIKENDKEFSEKVKQLCIKGKENIERLISLISFAEEIRRTEGQQINPFKGQRRKMTCEKCNARNYADFYCIEGKITCYSCLNDLKKN